MKVMEKIQISYVVPENEQEEREIKKLIKDFESEKDQEKIDFSKAKIIDNRKNLSGGGWKRD